MPSKIFFVLCQGHAADFADNTNEEEKPKSPDQARNSASGLRRCPACTISFLLTLTFVRSLRS